MSTSQQPQASGGEAGHSSGMKPYVRLLMSLVISYVVMLSVMFSRVNVWDNVFISLNQVYMAGLMVTPMLIIMLGTMGSMFTHKNLNIGLYAAGALGILLCWTLLRTQTGVGNDQFLRAMIPHHAGAILVCENADITDPRIKKLCEQIIESQEREIREMKAIMQDRK